MKKTNFYARIALGLIIFALLEVSAARAQTAADKMRIRQAMMPNLDFIHF